MEIWQIITTILGIGGLIFMVGKFIVGRLSKEIDQLRADFQPLRTDLRRVEDKSSKEVSDLKNEVNQQFRVLDIPEADLPVDLGRWVYRVSIQLRSLVVSIQQTHQRLGNINDRITATEYKIDDTNTKQNINIKQKLKYMGFGGLMVGIIFIAGYIVGKFLG